MDAYIRYQRVCCSFALNSSDQRERINSNRAVARNGLAAQLPYEHFNVEQVNDVLLVRLNSSRINKTLIIDELRNDLLSLLANSKPSKMIVSCNGVQRLSSESIEALLRARREMRKSDGDIKLCGLRPQVRQVFSILKLCGPIFKIYDNETEALEHFG